MTAKEKYYTSLPNHGKIEYWQLLMKDKKYIEATDYWKKNKLDPDSYVKKSDGVWVPVIYFCSIIRDCPHMVRTLVKNNANVNLLPDSETFIYLPFACQSLYLKTIGSKTINKPYPRSKNLDHSINNRLNVADIRRLSYLFTLNLLNGEIFTSFVADNPTIMLDKLKIMIKYLTFCYTIKAQNDPEFNLTEETNNTVVKFGKMLEFLQFYGAEKSVDVLDYCIDHYLFELVPLFKEFEMKEPIYHTQMDATEVAVLRPLLNDYRYAQTCKATGYEPDKDVFNLSIFK